MNNKIIKSFSVEGLFGTTDLTIPFDGKAKILIGENGLGKTQVLNMVYYTLTKKFDKLLQYVFTSVTLEFYDSQKIKIKKSEIEKSLFQHPLVRQVIESIGLQPFLEIRNVFSASDDISIELRSNPKFRKLVGNSIGIGMLSDALEIVIQNKQEYLPVLPISSIIDEHLQGYQILYLPTYRRIEVDLRTLGLRYEQETFTSNNGNERTIHFGMDDVDTRFEELISTIQKQATDGLSKISSEILSQLVQGLPPIDNDFFNRIDQQDIDIILARVGNKITVDDKIRIKNIVTTKDIQGKDHYSLYFLQKLINSYDQQRELDNSVRTFRDICNKYLVNKKVIYDESNVDMYIKVDDTTEKLPLSKLSLGEKQIISIFEKIYLSPPECNFIVLFDEPELSLSIFWQRQLLPDIFNSGKCQFLLAVTHSPFIFENELDEYAIGLGEYLKPIKTMSI